MSIARLTHVLAVAAFATVLAACHRRTPTEPEARPGIAGTWEGRITGTPAGDGRLVVEASTREPYAIGSFVLLLDDGTAQAGGTSSWDVTNAPTVDLFLVFTSARRDCPRPEGRLYRARMILTGGTRLTGTYEPVFGCPLLAGGSIELTRR